MKIIPAIDIMDGKTVRLKQGKYDDKINYKIRPLEAAKSWMEMGAELIHVVDLDGARLGRPVNVEVVAEIAKKIKVKIQTGGGYREIEDIRKTIDKGVYRVIVSSRAFEEMTFADKCVKSFGKSVIFSLDIFGGKIGVQGWEKSLHLDIFKDIVPFLEQKGVKEVIYTDIKSDGTLAGPDMRTIQDFIDKTKLKVIVAGGVKNIDHILKLKKLERKDGGVSGVIIGRALYDGTINLKEAINAC